MKALLNARLLVVSLALVATAVGCGKDKIEDTEEVAQAAGDAAGSLDEVMAGAGGLAVENALTSDPSSRGDALAATTACFTGTSFDACASGARTRTWGDCTVGSLLTYSGTVTLTFSEAAMCTFAGTGATVTRTPNFTITGRRGGTLTVSVPDGSTGQTLTRTATGITYSVGTVKRVLKDSSGGTLADVETKTTSAITVTGETRATRVANGGALEIKHITKNYTTTLTPTNLTWNGTCNCPVSGTLTGSISGDVEADDVTITFSGCGTGSISANGTSTDVTYDRCGSVSL